MGKCGQLGAPAAHCSRQSTAPQHCRTAETTAIQIAAGRRSSSAFLILQGCTAQVGALAGQRPWDRGKQTVCRPVRRPSGATQYAKRQHLTLGTAALQYNYRARISGTDVIRHTPAPGSPLDVKITINAIRNVHYHDCNIIFILHK